jgi:propionyl-CoA carboxylase alpha chain
VIDEGLVFIGPSPRVIAAMGSKMRAKLIALEAGVPVVPGYMRRSARRDHVLLARARIGYPLLLKASAGGGGKGMRVVRRAEDLHDGLQAARREARGAFGDDTLVLERYLERPRHIEIQILGDRHGNLVHLFERECSIQRRYQKIIEEAPSVALDDALREKMGQAASRWAAPSATTAPGTVEFILDERGAFYFLEVNTRLQVEHPVTEEITGVDLVRAQILVAEGHPLALTQATLRREGAALECRLYAEDPAAGFLPSTGRLVDWHVPAQEGLRVEAGVEAGQEVSIHYDPMIAKIITRGADRAEATRRMIRALRGLSVHGVQTNRQFLIDVLSHPAWSAGQLHTHFLEEHRDARFGAPPGDALRRRAAAAATAAAWLRRRDQRALLPSVSPGFRNNLYRAPQVDFTIGDEALSVSYTALGGDRLRLRPGGDGDAEVWALRGWEGGALCWREESTGIQRRARLVESRNHWYYQDIDGAVSLREAPRFVEPGAAAVEGACVAPMPGKVVLIRVTAGQQVEPGEVLVILEAMKMEHPVQAPRAGQVRAVLVEPGQQVEVDAPLITLDD